MIRKFIYRLLLGILMALPFLLVGLGVFELVLRSQLQMIHGNFRCLIGSRVETSTFAPNCSADVPTPRGPLNYRSNEDGFRDRARSEFSGGAVLVAGDSNVEGPWLREEETISRLLEQRLEKKFPFRFLNLGMRGGGPTQQVVRIYRALDLYPVKGLIWFLNPTDVLDEIYFHEKNPNYFIKRKDPLRVVARFEGRNPIWRWLFQFSSMLGDRMLSLLWFIDRFQLQWNFSRAVEEKKFDPAIHCRGIDHVAKEFQKNRIPLIFVLISHGPENRRDSYIGNPIPEGEFEKLASCATNTGAPVVRADREFSFKEELFWKNDWHLNPEGEKIFADYLTGKIFKLAP